MSHAIRHPLAAIFLHVDLLEEELRQPSPESAEQMAQTLTEMRMQLARLDDLEALGIVAFHPSTLRRALLNLVQNALEAMPQSGTLTLRGQSTPTHVQLHVRDTGSGVPVEQLAKIFEPLYTTKPGGTGLGLSIVQEIVAAHGGQVTVESVPGQGTTFTLTLPRAGPPGAP